MHTWRVLREFWRTSIEGELEYRGNFVLSVVTSLITLSGSVASLLLMYRHGGGVPGWSLSAGLVVIGLFSLFNGLSMIVLVPNLSRIVAHISDGTLEFILLKPVDAQLQVSLRVLSPWGAPDLLLGAALIVVGAARAGTSVVGVIAAGIAAASGAVILYALWFALATTAIWFVKVYNAADVLRGLLDVGRFPLDAYPAAYRFFFTFVLPIAFLTTVPADALLGRMTTTWWAGPAVAAVFFVGARRFWLRALRSYTGASG